MDDGKISEHADSVDRETWVQEKLVHSLWDVNHKMRKLYDGKASQSRILIVLQEHGAMTQRDLTQHLQIQPGSASEILAKLEKRGLIGKEPLASDRRTSRIFLTQEGSMLAQEALQQRHALHSEMFACLTAEEKEQLFALLGKMQADWDVRFPRCADQKEH